MLHRLTSYTVPSRAAILHCPPCDVLPQCGIHTSSESVCLTLLPLGSELRHAMGGVAGEEKVGDAAAAGLEAHTIIVTMEIK